MDSGKENFLVIDNVSKSYGVVHALKKVSFTIAKGEVHTLLGENGAGKSTLIKIISGEENPDTGSITLDGETVKHYSPMVAKSMGIAMVHQELAIFENMTVAENIFPTCEFLTKSGAIDKKRLIKEAQEKIDLFGMNLVPTQKMESLTVAQQQMTEILRAISAGSKCVLLDEPTSGLNKEETENLMKIIDALRTQGITIIYISHRIAEVMQISDRITVMRDGEYVCTFVNDENLKEIDLISRMVGRELTGSLYKRKEYTDKISEEVFFEVKDMNKKNAVYDISFQLKKGEVVGFFGLEGSGTNSVSRMIFGLEGMESGEVYFKGEKIPKVTTTYMVDKKIMYINNNRKQAGLLLDSSTLNNMSMPVLKQFSKNGIINNKKLVDHTTKFVNAFNVVIPSVHQKPRNLSGGNQQKVLLSICLGNDPELMIINEPTRGIDVGAKAEIHKFLLESVEKGVGLIVFSSELPELMSLCDRIIIMKNKRIVGEISKEEISEESIMTVAAGGI
jgi:ABC-type sugar transport system ATPase subunit